MRTLPVVIFLLFLFNSAALGQSHHVTIKGEGVLENMSLSRGSSPDKQIKGSVYWNQDYMYGTITLANDKKVNGMLRYNVRYQNFEVVLDRDTLYISEPSLVKKIDIGAKTFVFSLSKEEINGKPYISGGYFEVAEGQGDYPKLLVKHHKEVKESSYASTYMGGGGTGMKRYVDQRDYYIEWRDGSGAVRIDSRAALVSSLARDLKNKDKIMQYIQDNRLSVNNIDDLKNLIRYYHQL